MRRCEQGRDRGFVTAESAMVLPVLAHRLILRPESRLRKVTPEELLKELVSDVSVPVHSQREVDVDEKIEVDEDE